MSRFLLILFAAYIIWKIIKPYLKISPTDKFDVKGKRTQKNLHIDPDKIEDAKFKDIEDQDKS
jgi:rRNA processing protein Gar1